MINELALSLLMLAGQLSTIDTDNVESYKIIEGKLYSLSFEDEFEDKVLDSSKWSKCPEWKRQDLNNYWDDDMSYLDNKGNLIIEMSYDKENDRYLSGAVYSKHKYEQKYGYFEIKCTLNNVPGYWTAFWLMGDSVHDESMGGVNGTEIDIYESPFYNERKIQHTLNWDGYGAAHKYEGSIVDADVYDGKYHTFGLLWTEDEYVYYIDGTETWRTDAKKAMGTCETPLYMKITAEMGSWTPDDINPANFPDHIKVDHVKTYKEVK